MTQDRKYSMTKILAGPAQRDGRKRQFLFCCEISLKLFVFQFAQSSSRLHKSVQNSCGKQKGIKRAVFYMWRVINCPVQPRSWELIIRNFNLPTLYVHVVS